MVIVPDLEGANDLAFTEEAHCEYEGPGMDPSLSVDMNLDWLFVTLEDVRKLEAGQPNDEIVTKSCFWRVGRKPIRKRIRISCAPSAVWRKIEHSSSPGKRNV